MCWLFGGYPGPVWKAIQGQFGGVRSRVYEVMRRIRKCFKSGSPQVVLRGLDLTDTLMQACGAHVRREVSSDKFLKTVGKLCKITKTRLDPAWQAVAERAQELVAEWAEASERMVGTGNRFSQAYVNLRRDGVPFRGAGGGGDGGGGGLGGFGGGGGGGAFASSNSTARGARGTALRRDHRGAGSTRGLQPGDEGYDEEADLAAAIMASSLSAAGGGGGGGGHGSMDLSAAAADGDLLSMVPPTVEALMDIMEGSKDLTELLDNEVAPDVVDQTRGLVENVVKKVEELGRGGNSDEKDMDRYLKAHDDLQTVLRVYEAVLDGNETLPLKRGADAASALGGAAAGNGSSGGVSGIGGVGGSGGGAGGGGANGAGDGGGFSSDEEGEVVEGGKGAGGAGGVVRKKRGGSGSGRRRHRRPNRESGGSSGRRSSRDSGGGSSGRNSPTKGNLLDLEENTPLEMGMAGELAGGMMVAYSAGRFSANSASGGPAVFDSSSSAAQGSATASNFASDTGAVYGSNQFNSNNTAAVSDSGSGFAQADPFAVFASAPGAVAPNAPAPSAPVPNNLGPLGPAPRPFAGSFAGGLPEKQSAFISVTSSNASSRRPTQQPPADFASWMSSPIATVSSGFSSQDWQAAGAAPRGEASDPFSLGASAANSGGGGPMSSPSSGVGFRPPPGSGTPAPMMGSTLATDSGGFGSGRGRSGAGPGDAGAFSQGLVQPGGGSVGEAPENKRAANYV
eukprot:jgi/Undpi1/1332/HiC_scaffold_11.g04724.m1